MSGLYTYKPRWGGLTLEVFSPSEKSVAFLQGDDAVNLLNDLEACERKTYPSGPFASCEELQSVLLADYERDADAAGE